MGLLQQIPYLLFSLSVISSFSIAQYPQLLVNQSASKIHKTKLSMADKTKILPFQLSDGTIVNVEVTPIGEQPVSAETKIFQKATGIIKSIAEDVTGTLKDISETVKPDKFSVKLGLQIGVEAGELTALIVKGTGTANLEITMEWNK